MTQKDKRLLLADLCARLLYKPKALVNEHLATILGIDENVVIVCIDGNDYKDEIVISADDNSDDIKLYLRPMSSMTDEEIEYLYNVLRPEYDGKPWESLGTDIDWLNSRMLDYRELIPKGIALKALEGMYKIK